MQSCDAKAPANYRQMGRGCSPFAQAWAAQLPESAMAAVAIAGLTGDLTALAALAEALERLFVTCG